MHLKMYQIISVHKECSTRIVGVTSASFFEIDINYRQFRIAFHCCHPLLSPPITPLRGAFLCQPSYNVYIAVIVTRVIAAVRLTGHVHVL